jgi:hypothetical protein
MNAPIPDPSFAAFHTSENNLPERTNGSFATAKQSRHRSGNAMDCFTAEALRRGEKAIPSRNSAVKLQVSPSDCPVVHCADGLWAE